MEVSEERRKRKGLLQGRREGGRIWGDEQERVKVEDLKKEGKKTN